MHQSADRITMKFILFVSAVACVLAVGQSQTLLKKIALEGVRVSCAIKSMANPLLILKVRGGDFTVDDEHIKNYAFCIYNTLGISNDDGTPNKEAGLKLIGPETDPAKFSAAIDACAATPGDTPERKVWNFLLCYNQQYPGDISAI